MKKRAKARGLREKEPNGKDESLRQMNPALVPTVPGVLDTGSRPADLNHEFVSSSAPLAVKPPANQSKSEGGRTDSKHIAKAPPHCAPEYFNPTTSPLGEKPKKSAAVNSTSRRGAKISKRSETPDTNTSRP